MEEVKHKVRFFDVDPKLIELLRNRRVARSFERWWPEANGGKPVPQRTGRGIRKNGRIRAAMRSDLIRIPAPDEEVDLGPVWVGEAG